MALNNLQDNIQSKSAGMISYRASSYGQFKTKVTPLYWYGIPRNVELGGLTMDVDLMMNYQVEESNDYDKWLAFNQAQGARMSAMEHLVPEQMFSTEENPANGISAVKALQIAGAEGQRIWTITSENVDIAIPNLNLPDDIITEIRNSAAAGLEITAHEQPVNFYGSSQVGYIILDPATGAGAYKIGGGENGGELDKIPSGYSQLSKLVLYAPPVTIKTLPKSSQLESIKLYGFIECELNEVKATIAAVIAIVVIGLLFKRMIAAAIAIPEIGISVAILIRGVIISALTVAGVANAEEAADDQCKIGNCTARQHRELEEEKDKYCSQASSCSSSMSQSVLAERALIALNCATARKNIMDQCFDGGDEGHQAAYNDAMRNYERCVEILSGL